MYINAFQCVEASSVCNQTVSLHYLTYILAFFYQGYAAPSLFANQIHRVETFDLQISSRYYLLMALVNCRTIAIVDPDYVELV